MVEQIAPEAQQAQQARRTQKIDQMTLDDFMQRYDQEGPFEYINGEIIPLSPNKSLHSVMIKALFLALQNYSSPKQLGEAYIEAVFVLLDQPNWVKGSRVLDVLFYRAHRYADYKSKTPDWRDKPFALVPDLVAEVVSPTDSYIDIENKATQYLRDGVPLIWIVDPHNRTVRVYHTGTNQQIRLGDEDTLDGGEVIPGFELSLKQLFDAE